MKSLLLCCCWTLLLLLVVAPQLAGAFSVSRPRFANRTPRPLIFSTGENTPFTVKTKLFVLKDPRQSGFHNNNDNDDEPDIEAERQRLQNLLYGSTFTATKDSTDNNHHKQSTSTTTTTGTAIHHWKQMATQDPVAPLTTIGRERLFVEMALLQQLASADEPIIGDLEAFWYNARGKQKQAALVAADNLVFFPAHNATLANAQEEPSSSLASPQNNTTNLSHEEAEEEDNPQMRALGMFIAGPQNPNQDTQKVGSTRRRQAEELYRSLIHEEGIYWVEPLYRLARLLHSEHRLVQAKELCHIVLAVKPWHFPCCQVMAEVCDKLGDTHAAHEWSSKCLPPLQNTAKRRQWVHTMVKKVQTMLERGDQGIHDSFQAVDHPLDKKDPNNQFDQGAWE